MFLNQYSLLQNNMLAVTIPCTNIEKVNYIYTRIIPLNYKIKFAMLRTELKSRDNKIICLIRDYTYLELCMCSLTVIFFEVSDYSVTFFFSYQKNAKISSERFKNRFKLPAE